MNASAGWHSIKEHGRTVYLLPLDDDGYIEIYQHAAGWWHALRVDKSSRVTKVTRLDENLLPDEAQREALHRLAPDPLGIPGEDMQWGTP